MGQFGLDFKSFFDEYFQKNDEAFLANLSEIISEKDDSREIAALADWSFRNYIIEAVTAALELNNKKILRDILTLIESGDIEPRRSAQIPQQSLDPGRTVRTVGKSGTAGLYETREMQPSGSGYGARDMYGAPQPYAEEEEPQETPQWEENQPVDFNFEA